MMGKKNKFILPNTPAPLALPDHARPLNCANSLLYLIFFQDPVRASQLGFALAQTFKFFQAMAILAWCRVHHSFYRY
jgi:hypothetical protein